MDSPQIDILYKSDFCQINNYKCNCTKCHTSKAEITGSFNFCFVRTGYFEYQIFKREFDAHVGRVVVSKPGCEHITRHIENQPDVCTVFNFDDAFFQSIQEHYKQEVGWFFQNRDIQSLLLPCPPALDYTHRLILQQTHKDFPDVMQMDDLILHLVNTVIEILGNKSTPASVHPGLKRHHLSTVEKAKEYLMKHFSDNISLQRVAEHCCVSLFHFSRIFKSIMKISPYQYVNEIRLQHANFLLENSTQPIVQIAFQCGFNSLEHFDNVYRQRFKMSPSSFRRAPSFSKNPQLLRSDLF